MNIYDDSLAIVHDHFWQTSDDTAFHFYEQTTGRIAASLQSKQLWKIKALPGKISYNFFLVVNDKRFRVCKKIIILVMSRHDMFYDSSSPHCSPHCCHCFEIQNHICGSGPIQITLHIILQDANIDNDVRDYYQWQHLNSNHKCMTYCSISVSITVYTA